MANYLKVTQAVTAELWNGDTHTYAVNDLVDPRDEFYPALAAVPGLLVDSGTALPSSPPVVPSTPSAVSAPLYVSATAPTNPYPSTLWWDISTETPKRWNGTAWIVAANFGVATPADTVDGKVVKWNKTTGHLEDGTAAVVAAGATTYATVGALAPKPPIRPKLTYLTTFKSGHGWTLTATGGTAADDTVNFEYGDRSVKGVTNGTGGNFSADKSALPAMDLTNRTLAFRVRVDDWTKVDLTSGIICYLGDDSLTNYVIVSMVLGKAPGSTSISYPTPANEWAWLYVDANEGIIGSGGTGAAILSNVTHVLFRAIDQATGPVTVNLGAVAYYTRQNVFPNGVLTLWFDDSYGSQYTLARQVCDTYGFGFQLSTIIDSVDTAGQLTLAQLHDLEDNHGCEVSAHAYYGANHNAGFTTLSQADLDTDLRLSKEWLTAERFRGSDFMSFPLGDENAAVRDRVRRYFSHSRHVDGRLPKLNIDQPLRFGARIVNATTPTATLTGYIDSAVSGSYSTSRWLHLVFHKILASGSTASTEYDQANFQTVIDYAATKGIPVMTMSDVLRKL